jgi:hypothetical protein
MNQVSRKCARTTAHAFLQRRFHLIVFAGSTVSKSSDLPFVSRNSDPVLRSIVRLSFLCSSIRINLDLCSTCVIHVNCNWIILYVLSVLIDQINLSVG